MTLGLLSQVTLPCALKHHEALCCPALAILVPVMPRDQPNGAKLREPPASKRLHEPTRTWRKTSPAVMPQTGLHNTPLSAKRASQRARPATDGSRQASQASEPGLIPSVAQTLATRTHHVNYSIRILFPIGATTHKHTQT